MKPLYLSMTAFGPYRGTAEVDFASIGNGIYVIAGPTGAGKTTIFDAIVYALYGDKSEKNTNKNAVIPNLQSQFAPLDVTPFVELTFAETVGGRSGFTLCIGFRTTGARQSAAIRRWRRKSPLR